MNTIKRTNSVITISPSASLDGYEGYAVDQYGRPSATPVGIVVQGYGAGEPSSIAMLAGGYSGTLLVKLAENVSAFTYVGPTATGTLSGGAVAKCAQTLETGTTGELVEAIPFKLA